MVDTMRLILWRWMWKLFGDGIGHMLITAYYDGYCERQLDELDGFCSIPTKPTLIDSEGCHTGTQTLFAIGNYMKGKHDG